MSAPDTSVTVGRIRLKNPLICGSGEHLMDAEGITAALKKGAGAVVVKSANDSAAAKRQLQQADYALYDSAWRPLHWNFSPPADASLFCRSGLAQQSFEEWLELVAATDGRARQHDSYVVASLIPTDTDAAVDYARRIEAAGVRVLEVNIGAPHGEEASAGSITLERDEQRVRKLVAGFRDAVSIPLWIKLTGQSTAIDALAEAARDGGADAVTIMGRFMAFLPDLETLGPALSTRAAIGGGWALPLSCDWVRKARARLGPAYPLIGTNGARSGADIARFMLAGATAVQMTTAVFTGGFGVIASCLSELEAFLAARGMAATDLIGLAADKLQSYQAQPIRPSHWKKFTPRTED